ncbi:MAG: hypothetical protein LBB18_01880 [Puniceicoccales bacterium]|jgi:hypothetical protein|nr:hypothetical protein [Puniceicoccales bacterium]
MASVLTDEGVFSQQVDPVDVSFNNLFVGMERFFSFENEANRYSVSLKPKNIGLDVQVLLKVKVAGFDAEVLLATFSNLGSMDQRFTDIDLMLFDDDIKIMLLNCIFEKEMPAFAAKVGLAIELKSVTFGKANGDTYEKEIGVNISKNENFAVTFNLKLNNDLMNVLNMKFEKIPVVNRELPDGLPFEWYLEIGKTNLCANDCQTLEEYDIVFLDENASFKTGKYEIKGLDSMKLCGKLDGCNLVIESGNFAK